MLTHLARKSAAIPLNSAREAGTGAVGMRFGRTRNGEGYLVVPGSPADLMPDHIGVGCRGPASKHAPDAPVEGREARTAPSLIPIPESSEHRVGGREPAAVVGAP